MMPKMDGMELLKRIRQDFNISHIPVIILTAKQGDEIHTQAISTGANAYITKPFSSDLLQARISQLLEEQRIFQRKMVLTPAGTPRFFTLHSSLFTFHPTVLRIPPHSERPGIRAQRA